MIFFYLDLHLCTAGLTIQKKNVKHILNNKKNIMTTEKKVQRLKANGWNVVFNDKESMHEADRGCVKYRSINITSLYKSIKNEISQ